MDGNELVRLLVIIAVAMPAIVRILFLASPTSNKGKN